MPLFQLLMPAIKGCSVVGHGFRRVAASFIARHALLLRVQAVAHRGQYRSLNCTFICALAWVCQVFRMHEGSRSHQLLHVLGWWSSVPYTGNNVGWYQLCGVKKMLHALSHQIPFTHHAPSHLRYLSMLLIYGSRGSLLYTPR